MTPLIYTLNPYRWGKSKVFILFFLDDEADEDDGDESPERPPKKKKKPKKKQKVQEISDDEDKEEEEEGGEGSEVGPSKFDEAYAIYPKRKLLSIWLHYLVC